MYIQVTLEATIREQNIRVDTMNRRLREVAAQAHSLRVSLYNHTSQGYYQGHLGWILCEPLSLREPQ